jgi:hypothetical protein
MKRTLFLFCFLAGTAWAQEGIILKSEPLILKPKNDLPPPRVRILEPRSASGGNLIVTTDSVSVKGVATSEIGIRMIEINGLLATRTAAGDFELTIPLLPGKNQITVTVQDVRGTSNTDRFEVTYGAYPPVIEILEPKGIEVRGIRRLEAAQVLMLRGKAYGGSGIRNLRVNGSTVPVASDSVFWKELRPPVGQDSIVVEATDNAGRTSRKMLYLERKLPPPDFLTGKSYALIIGIDSYNGVWQALKNAVRDARAVETLLKGEFQFEHIYSLYEQEATRDNIIGKIEWLVRNLKPEDNLLVYYSGHGYKDEDFNKGFWVPIDATEQSVTRYISNSDIQTMLNAKSPRHVLLVADACFAGDIFKGSRMMSPLDNSPDFYMKESSRKSRQALTSGGVEPVLDGGREGHSVFAYYFLQAMVNLRGAYFDAGQVYDELRIPVTRNSDQIPQFAPIKDTGDEGGQFIFVRK